MGTTRPGTDSAERSSGNRLAAAPHRRTPMLGWLYPLSFKHFEDLFARGVPVYAQVSDLSYCCM
jgi:hypothetical protein